MPTTFTDLPRLMTLMTGDEKHGPSATSTLDVLWVLYDRVLRVSPDTAVNPDRDRFLLSKGHGPAAYYAVLAAKGFFPEGWLPEFAQAGSPLGRHPDRNLIPGVEIASGSLGHGLPLGVGIAHGLLAAGLPEPRVFVLVGDAELDEGSNNEAIVYTGAVGLPNITVVAVDNQSSTYGSVQSSTVITGDATIAAADMRTAFAEAASTLLDDDPLAAVVLAEISADMFTAAAQRHPGRVINVGIREQLMIGVAGGLALAGLRPIAHSYAPFLVERAFEQVKLDLAHQNAHAVLVSVGASYDYSHGGETHHAPEDVALMDTIAGLSVHVPGHPAEVGGLLADAIGAVAGDSGHSSYIRLSTARNRDALPLSPRLRVVRPGGAALVIAVGPMLDPVLAAVEGLDVTVAYATTVRPFDLAGLRALAGAGTVVLAEPYLAGTSARLVDEALADLPHRTLGLGVRRGEHRLYGTPDDHAKMHGLDPAGLRRSVTAFLTSGVQG